MTFWHGLLLALSLVVPPGPVAVAQLQAGLAGGWRRSFALGLGASGAVATYAVAGLVGGAALTQVPVLRQVLWLGGIAVLAGYGLLLLREAALGAALPATGVRRGAGGGHPFAAGWALGALNPFTLVFLLALASTPDRSAPGGAALFLGGLLTGAVGWNVLLAGASDAGSRLLRPPIVRALRLAGGVVLLGFAAGLALRGP